MKKIISVIMLVIMAVCLCSCEKELTPIYADEINDGTYNIEVKSSSSMFKIIDCQLTVAGEKMTAVMTLSGTGYEKLFLGTREEADIAPDSKFSYFIETAEGRYCYEIPVEALDKEFSCAGFSIRKQKWYDRTLVFMSDTLPDGALKFDPVPVIIIVTAALLVISAAGIIIVKRKRGK
ncbi:MAG: hypothetical protein IJZ72_10145 [Oscillospiraceae bacterium]|nr:hypothetical protein [Oscillospiraceae bacterium]MBQ8826388.1 hypothetical protein [Oscillospiraceae bacterium]